jgi:hypothetical protein
LRRQAEVDVESARKLDVREKRRQMDEERRVAAESRRAADAWFRGRQEELRSTLPMRAAPTLAAARADGISGDALRSITTTVVRRGRPEDGEFLAMPHEFLQRDWMPTESSPAA